MTMTPAQALRTPKDRVTPGAGRSAAFFDLDGTLIPGSANVPLARAAFRAGLVTPQELVRDLRNGAAFLLKGATDERREAVRDRILSAVAGRPAEEMTTLADVVIPELVASIPPAVHAVLDEHATAGRDRVLLSASPTEIVTGLASAAGLEQAAGTTSEVDDEGRYTGRLAGPSCAAEGKAEILRAVAQERDYDLAASYAYADSMSDLPILEAVGHPVVVNPEAELREIAEDRGWPIVETSRFPRVAVTDLHGWVRMSQRLAVASVGAVVALGTRPIEALGGIDGVTEAA